MNESWRDSLSASARAFAERVWPVVASRFFGDGDAIPVETDTGLLARKWDALAGIDVWQVRDKTGMRGIASRVQQVPAGKPPYDTFTIRKARDTGALTEFEKRLRAIDNPDGWVCPHLTIQAFVRSPLATGELLSAAAARTADIVRMILDGHAGENRTANAEFYVIAWDDMRRHGFDVKTYYAPRLRRRFRE